MNPNALALLQLAATLGLQAASIVQTLHASGGNATEADVQNALAQAQAAGDQLQAMIDAANAANAAAGKTS